MLPLSENALGFETTAALAPIPNRGITADRNLDDTPQARAIFIPGPHEYMQTQQAQRIWKVFGSICHGVLLEVLRK
jgi:hypothetical protein